MNDDLRQTSVIGSRWGVPVMRVTTLKASSDKLGALIDYYAGLAEDRARAGLGRGPVDYYLDPDEPPGRWWGSGLDALGLAGEVHGEQLRSLLAATDPRTGWSLGRSFGEKSARGFDATFSAPKSVSALWALTPDRWMRAEVLAAHDAAVTDELGWFEKHGAVTKAVGRSARSTTSRPSTETCWAKRERLTYACSQAATRQ